MAVNTSLPPFLRKKKVVALIILVILAIAVITSTIFVVDQTEEAVVLFLGQYSRIAQPGLNIKLPFGIEKNFNIPTQVIQNMSFGFRTERPGITTVFSDVDYPEESVMLTGDLNIVDVEWIIQYRIVDPRRWLFNVENRVQTIRDISQSVVNQLVGDRTIIDVLGSERSNIEIAAQDEMNRILASYGIGVNVTAVRLQNIVPPSGSVQDAFEDVNRAVQDMNRLINEGREAYNTEIPRARGEAEQIIQISMGYASERVNNARGDVNRFISVLGEYRKAPNITRKRLYYEMVEDVFTQEGVELVDKNLSNFIPFLNLNSNTRGGINE